MEFLILTSLVRSVLQSHEGFLLDDLINLRIFFRYRGMLYVKLYVFCETNSLVHSKQFMNVINGIRNFFYASKRFHQEHFWSTISLRHISERHVVYKTFKFGPSSNRTVPPLQLKLLGPDQTLSLDSEDTNPPPTIHFTKNFFDIYLKVG